MIVRIAGNRGGGMFQTPMANFEMGIFDLQATYAQLQKHLICTEKRKKNKVFFKNLICKNGQMSLSLFI